MLPQSRVLIIDFGSQYTQLIAKRIRALDVYCEILPYHTSSEKIVEFNPNGIVLSGSPDSSIAAKAPKIPDSVFTLGCPVLGICYGMQAMVAHLGGQVENAKQHEYGSAKLQIIDVNSQFLKDIEDSIEIGKAPTLDVWMSHGDRVIEMPKGFEVIGSSDHCPIAAIADETRHYYGVQFHPEVSHTRQGNRLIARFVIDICQASTDWSSQYIVEHQVEAIAKKVGTAQVILGLSGGVDSQVAAALLHRAIGDQLICLYVDTGLMRLNETAEVIHSLKVHEGVNIQTIDAKTMFLEALVGISDPEQKRKIIGKLFVDIFTEHAKQYPDVQWLAQGTIYSDVIESASDSNSSHLIKSHHNVGGLPENMSLKLIEPLRECFKDEVREIGLECGLPYDNVYRHPFPGPGLAVRILGAITETKVDILQRVDAIFMQALKDHEWYHKVSQAFAVLLPVKSVGVGGDSRRYGYVVALRAVSTTDFMTAHWVNLPYEFLNEVSTRILNQVHEVARVTYDISNKPPATIEWE